MADDEMVEEQELSVPEMWQLIKPVIVEDDDEDESPRGRKKQLPAPKIGKLVKMLNDIEEQEELEAKVQELDPASGQSLLVWATLHQKFVLVEWLVKKCKRAAFAFAPGQDNQLSIFDKWAEIRREIAEREKEKARAPPEEADDEEEEKEAEPLPEQLVYDALSEFHDDWGKRGQGLVKLIGELGVYQGARDSEFTKEGVGQTLYPNGDMYCGEFRNNKRHGFGTYYWASQGMLYTGRWCDNVRDGIGRMVFPDGGRYLGAWAADKQNGEGRYTYPDGSSYAGTWECNTKNGLGTYTFVDGSVFVGAFVDGAFISGEWRMSGGSTRYYGAFVNDAPAGAGVFVFKHGTEGSFRQEGVYADGKWNPVGGIKNVRSKPQLRLIIQKKELTLEFSDECGALTMEQLVLVSNFQPFILWVRQLCVQNKEVTVGSVLINGVRFAKDSSVDEVRLKVVADDGATGKRIRSTDGIILAAPTTRLLVVLNGAGKTICLLERQPSAACATSEQLLLPAVKSSADGTFHGPFIDFVEPALRISLRRDNTKAILSNIFCAPHKASIETEVRVYIQDIHEDAMSTLQSRLSEKSSPLYAVVGLRLSEVAGISSDAISLASVSMVLDMMSTAKLPTATVDAQRPPTPIPPPAEPRPDIEPLLEAERRAQAAKQAAEADE